MLEVAILNVISGKLEEFERAFEEAQKIIAASEGYIGHQLRKCLEVDGQYILLVEWQTLEAHTIGFRGSAAYQKWNTMIHHFYDHFPTVMHYSTVY